MSDRTLLNVYQARDMLGVSIRTIYNMIHDGRLVKVDTKYATMVTWESVNALLNPPQQAGV